MPKHPTIHLPPVIGHRGAAGHAPENTLASLRKAAELGVRWVEFDVVLTADKVPVLLHDEQVDRTTSGRGSIARLSFEEAARLDASAWFSPEFAGERIPSLAQAIELLAQLDLNANVELKPARGFAKETGWRVAQLLRNRWPRSLQPPLLSSFQPDALAAARDAAPELPRGLLLHRRRRDWRARAQRLDCISVHSNHRVLNLAYCTAIRDAGYSLLAYTVNEPEIARQLFDWGVQAVFSDYPDRILSM